MTNPILAVLVNSATGIFLSGLYFAMATRVWHRRGKVAAMLSLITAILYSIPTASYIWSAFHGTARTTASWFGLVLLILPALLVFQVLGWSWRTDADADTIVRDLNNA